MSSSCPSPFRTRGATLCAVLTVSLAACGGGGTDPADNPVAEAPAPVPPSSSDRTPPTVLTTQPTANATAVSTRIVIQLNASEPLRASSVSAATVMVAGVSGSVALSGGNIIQFTPSAPLAAGSTYVVTVKGGSGGIKDVAGNSMATDRVFSFTTLAVASPSPAPSPAPSPSPSPAPSPAPSPSPTACGGTVRCVGTGQAYATIQAGVDAARAGDTVLVFDGNYAGFTLSRSGSAGALIAVKAQGTAAAITSANGSGEGITISNASYVSVEGFKLDGFAAYCIGAHNATATVPMHNVTVRNNTVSNCGSANIYLSELADSLVEGNVTSGSKASHGIYLANAGSKNTVVRGNRSFNNAVNGMHFNGDSSVGGNGLQSGLLIEGNVLYGNVQNGINMDGVQASTLRNNVVYGNGRNAVRGYAIDGAAGPSSMRIINNTLDVPTGGGWALKFTEDGGGHVIFNNIMLAASGATGSLCVANTSFQSDRNLLTDRLSINGEASVISLSAWKGLGYDAVSAISTGAALFVGGTDYRLRSGAAAANAGQATFGGVAAPLTDLLGVARPQGAAIDIGAYESF